MVGCTTSTLRDQRGFTLIELLVVVVLIGILIAAVTPAYLAGEQKSKISAIKSNMHQLQISAEQYSVDAAGQFPPLADGLAPYMPGGQNTLNGTAGAFPQNPVTGIRDQVPAPCSIAGEMWISLMRTTTGNASFGGGPGQTAYDGITDSEGAISTFAITGNGADGAAIQSHAGYAVLSNE